MAPRTRPPLWSPSPCRSSLGGMVPCTWLPYNNNLRRSVYMPHPCGISYVVLGASRYLERPLLLLFFQSIVVPFRVPRRARAVDRNTQSASVEKTLSKKHCRKNTVEKHRRRQLLQYYDTNFYICDSRENPNATHQSSFAGQ